MSLRRLWCHVRYGHLPSAPATFQTQIQELRKLRVAHTQCMRCGAGRYVAVDITAAGELETSDYEIAMADGCARDARRFVIGW